MPPIIPARPATSGNSGRSSHTSNICINNPNFPITMAHYPKRNPKRRIVIGPSSSRSTSSSSVSTSLRGTRSANLAAISPTITKTPSHSIDIYSVLREEASSSKCKHRPSETYRPPTNLSNPVVLGLDGLGATNPSGGSTGLSTKRNICCKNKRRRKA